MRKLHDRTPVSGGRWRLGRRRLGAILVLGAVMGWGLVGCGPLGRSAEGPAEDGKAGGSSGLVGREGPRLVVLYATCTLERSFLGPYGADPSLTPAISAFARRGTVFPRHMTESGQSGTAFAALFTGLHADGHGVYRHPTPLAPSVPTLFEHFREGGWDTLAFLDHGMASAELGFARGASKVFDRRLEAGDPAFVGVLDRLAREPDYRALVVTNFTVTHGPYQPGSVAAFCERHGERGGCGVRDRDPEAFERYAELYVRAHAHLSYDFPSTRERLAMDDERLAELVEVIELLYRANVGFLDHLFGRLLATIEGAGLAHEAIVALTADHGETLYREETLFKWTHGHQLAQEVLTVPLVMAGPGVSVGRYPQPSRSVDVFPTLAGLVGLPVPALEGRSAQFGVDLSRVLRGDDPAPRLPAFSHTSLVSEAVIESSRKWELFHAYHPRVDPRLLWVQSVRGDRLFQVRRGPAPGEGPGEAIMGVFDLSEDPLARRPLHDDPVTALADPEEGVAIRAGFRELEDYRQALIEGWARWAARGDGVEAERQEELLRSLGYVVD